MDAVCSLFHPRCSIGANMKEFADELRASREAKHISLADIASATKIQLKYLRAMEEGEFSFLPPPYARAFIRDYAKALDLDQDVTLQRYDAALAAAAQVTESRQPERKTTQSAPPRAEIPAEMDLRSRREEEAPPPPRGILRSLWLSFRALWIKQVERKKFLPVAAVIIVVAIVILVSNMTKNSEKDSTREIPFEQVIKEKERASNSSQYSLKSGVETSASPGDSTDSLVLEGRTTQEVWMRLLIDDGLPKEYIFPPRAIRTWKARDKFAVTLGNAGAITFKLNGKDIGTLGKPGAVTRNTVITRDRVQK